MRDSLTIGLCYSTANWLYLACDREKLETKQLEEVLVEFETGHRIADSHASWKLTRKQLAALRLFISRQHTEPPASLRRAIDEADTWTRNMGGPT